VARGISSLIPAIGGIDVLVFTGGIGEHSAPMRQRICEFLSWLGIVLDDDKNTDKEMEEIISRSDTSVKVLVVPADEEIMIARETWALLKKE